tara:strand:+ start:646 stop:1284 length:639 start_codon:yes stop_codon:yes gene_type:complete
MRKALLLVVLIMIGPCFTVQAHTPNVMMSILKEGGPEPEDVLETAGLVEGDGIKFKVGDTTNNSSMRISIDIDKNGMFNDSVDFISSWMVYDCVYDENGTLLDENCSESVVFYFNGTNGSGIYDYQLERMVNDSHTNFWLNTIFVGVDDHSDSSLPSVGDCFGAGCEEEVVDSSDDVEDGYEKYIPLLMIVSAVGLVGVTISLINEKNSEEE